MLRGLLVAAFAALTICGTACPNCRNSTEIGASMEAAAARQRGYLVSILVMGSVPFVSVAALGLYCAKHKMLA